MTSTVTAMVSVAKRFLVDESGPTAIEYAFLLAVIVLAATAAIASIGSGNTAAWTTISSRVPAAQP